MASNIDKSILQYYEEKANTLSKDMLRLREISSNRYGIVTGCLHAILGYQQHFGVGNGKMALDTVKEARAFLEWSNIIPQEKWLNYSEAREIPFKWRELWKKYKASGSTETFMSWWEEQ